MNADPRRPEKVQRYTPKNNSNGEDLTPDYINIIGQPPTTANAADPNPEKHSETSASVEPSLQVRPSTLEELHPHTNELAVTTNATNVIPTSPQYGVAILPNSSVSTVSEIASEIMTQPTETVTDSTVKGTDDNTKDLHSTPSRNDRFKVVKIASLEPFKRGRWKCMDYVDEAPPVNSQVKITQSTGNIPVTAGVYLQTQSLPQQQIQQMLLQGGFTNGTQFFPNLMQQAQYFYPQAVAANVQTQTIPQQIAGAIPAQFINNPQYFPAGVLPNAAGFQIPQGYQNIQYIPANLIQNPNSAFVPTSQPVQLPANFQQSQTYAGQPNVTQANVITQPLVNGHSSYPSQNETITASSLPTQSVKSVIMNTQPIATPQNSTPNAVQNNQPQSLPVLQSQQQQQQQQFQQNSSYPHTVIVASVAASQPTTQTPGQSSQNVTPLVQAPIQPATPLDHNFASNVYTNPQFTMSVNSLNVLENNEPNTEANDTSSVAESASENADDPSKTNPVVNAIDNKIEQAMDLVKSHLMYTVREEVEVLKEKIAELMERIQQLESENNYLRSQIPKSQNVAPSTTNSFVSVVAPSQPSAVTATPSPNVISSAGSQTSVNNPTQATNAANTTNSIPNKDVSTAPQ